ncbi:MAG: phage integrase N-terminal SAM-like domain-containing protein [Myxococcales bacterium]|nr:phage integrase N-terminal SAM-like domain-containing protein [Myxococcales bacterium]
MAQDLRLRGLSAATQKHYLCFVGVFARYHGQSPANLGTEHVRNFFLHLEGLGRANATRMVYWCALNFLYVHTLGRSDVVRARWRRREVARAMRPVRSQPTSRQSTPTWVSRSVLPAQATHS